LTWMASFRIGGAVLGMEWLERAANRGAVGFAWWRFRRWRALILRAAFKRGVLLF
jgi:hypothetical protein